SWETGATMRWCRAITMALPPGWGWARAAGSPECWHDAGTGPGAGCAAHGRAAGSADADRLAADCGMDRAGQPGAGPRVRRWPAAGLSAAHTPGERRRRRARR